MEVLTTAQPAAWKKVIEQSTQYDFYHLAEYHALAEAEGEGTAHLFHYTEGGYSIALPLLLRSLDMLPGVQAGKGWHDATSVYGYAGPISSSATAPEAIVRNFQAALHEQLLDLRVVSAFSRLHPTIPQRELLSGLGECRALAHTVSIDLTQSAEDQRAAFRKNHKEGINKLRRLGVTCVHDREGIYLEDYLRIYHETMHRVGAVQTFFYPPSYFKRLFETLGTSCNLFVCLHGGKPICGGIFIESCGLLQYHLGGTLTEALKLAPMKLMVDDVRLWGTRQGYHTFHLGGGATARPDDPLLHFKIGFSNRVHEFAVWRWILAPDLYRRLCADKTRWNECHELQTNVPNYFPEYRCPTVPCDLPAPNFGTSEALAGVAHAGCG